MNFWTIISFSSLFFFACQKTDLNNSSGNQDSVSALPQQPFRVFAAIYSGNPQPGFNLNKINDSASLAFIENKLHYFCDSDIVNLPESRQPKSGPLANHSYAGFYASSSPEDTVFGRNFAWKCSWGTLRIYHENLPSVCLDPLKGLDSDLYLPDPTYELEKRLLKIAWDQHAIPEPYYHRIDSIINANAIGN